jgi:hypothetical protein
LAASLHFYLLKESHRDYSNMNLYFMMSISISCELSIGWIWAERPIIRSTARASVSSKYALIL